MNPLFEKLEQNIHKVMIGKEETIEQIFISLLANGHVLLEDVPGTGKTVLAKSLAKSLDLDFNRIQFTPDLLPSDITGINYFHQKIGDFVFKSGPVFTNILLADEINRATPRTQSALLECMAEKQVTFDGETHKLDHPFFVLATENPIETTGTFPLPEAELDRFFMKLPMGGLTKEEELNLVNRFIADEPLETLEKVATKEELIQAQNEVKSVKIHPILMDYLVSICQATREKKTVISGVSPRGTLAFLHASMACAYLNGRDYVVPEDIKFVAIPVLAHRIVLERSQNAYRFQKDFIQQILNEVTVPTENWSL